MSADPVRFERFTREALEELKKRDIPRKRAADYFSKTDEPRTPQEEAAADKEFAGWDEYLSQFAQLGEGGTCICCGAKLAGGSLSHLLGLSAAFEWGLANGEGHCSACHYPMRGHHRVPELGNIHNLYLQYHPSALSFPAKEAPDVR